MICRLIRRSGFVAFLLLLAPWAALSVHAVPDHLNAADGEMLVAIATANRSQITAGELVVAKSTRQEVRAYAEATVAAHAKAQIDVEKLATAKHFKLPQDLQQNPNPPKGLQHAGRDRLDSEYLRLAVADQEATIALLKRTQMSAQDVDLRALAGKLLQAVSPHLQDARRLQKK